jgi:hypothetical protein
MKNTIQNMSLGVSVLESFYKMIKEYNMYLHK